MAGAANVTTSGGLLSVNLFGISGVTAGTSGTYTLITGASGTLTNGSYSLGTVYNASNFTVNTNSLSATSSTLTVGITGITANLTDYWKGGFTGGANVWAASDGSVNSNWTTDAAGMVPTSLTPGADTAVVFSATGAGGQSSMTLGANMSIAGITFGDAGSDTLASDGNTLTIATTSGITISSGTGVTLNPGIVLSWQPHKAGPLTTPPAH